MRTKGGINNTILVDEIDIAKMGAFQLKGYDLQAYDKKFKPTHPGFDPEVVLKKIKGEDIIQVLTILKRKYSDINNYKNNIS